MWLPRDAGVDRPDLDAGHRLRALDGVLDRADRPVDVGDDPLAQPAARHHPDAEDRDPVAASTSADDGAHLGGPDVETDDDLALRSCGAHRSRQSHAGARRAKSRQGNPAQRSAHPDDDAIGARVVVEHDGVGLGASPIELGYDPHRLIELSPEGGRARGRAAWRAAADDDARTSRPSATWTSSSGRRAPSAAPLVLGGEVDGAA